MEQCKIVKVIILRFFSQYLTFMILQKCVTCMPLRSKQIKRKRIKNEWTLNKSRKKILWYKLCSVKKMTNLNSTFCSIKSSGIVFIFLPAFYLIILPMTHQRFFLNSHFKNMTASFLLRCQNLLRYFTPEMMHFQAWKKLIFTNISL